MTYWEFCMFQDPSKASCRQLIADSILCGMKAKPTPTETQVLDDLVSREKLVVFHPRSAQVEICQLD